MNLYDSQGCGGWEFWLNFKQGEKYCKIQNQKSSESGKSKYWNKNQLGNCTDLSFDVNYLDPSPNPIEFMIQSNNDNEFCPRKVTVSFLRKPFFTLEASDFNENGMNYKSKESHRWIELHQVAGPKLETD